MPVKIFTRNKEDPIPTKIETVLDSDNPFYTLADHTSAFRHQAYDGGIKSYEGFYKNEHKQRQAASSLADLLDMHGRFLDVGYGNNIYVADEFANQGMEAAAMDIIPYSNNLNVQMYTGSARSLGDPKKGLPEHYDTIAFWGNWFSMGEAPRRIPISVAIPSIEYSLTMNKAAPRLEGEFLNMQRSMLHGASRQLAYSGQLMFVSNRYNYAHSPTFLYEELPEEKRRMLQLAGALEDIGADELLFLGTSIPVFTGLVNQNMPSYVASYTHQTLAQWQKHEVGGMMMKRQDMTERDCLDLKWKGETHPALLKAEEQMNEVLAQLTDYRELKNPEISLSEMQAVNRFSEPLENVARIEAVIARFYR